MKAMWEYKMTIHVIAPSIEITETKYWKERRKIVSLGSRRGERDASKNKP